MGAITRAALKAFFETNDIPTESQYADFIDSCQNITDDGLALIGSGTIAQFPIYKTISSLENSILSQIATHILTQGGFKGRSSILDKILDDLDSGALIQFNANGTDDFQFTTDDGAYAEGAIYMGNDGLEVYLNTNAVIQNVLNNIADFTGYFNTAGYMADMGAMGIAARQPIYRALAVNSVALGGTKLDVRNPNTAYVKHLGYTEDAVIAVPAKQLIIDPPATITEDRVITWPDASGVVQLQSQSFYDPTLFWELTSHFMEDSDVPTGWEKILIGAGAKIDASADQLAPNRPGIHKLETGTDAAGVAMYVFGNDQTGLMLGGGLTLYECAVYIPILATAIEDFIMRLGFGDEVDGSEHDDGSWLENNRSVSLNWGLKTAKTAARTTTDSGDVVDVATWIKVGAIVNAAASSIEYFIGGVSVGTIVTNIPVSDINPSISIVKTAGIINRVFLVDLYHARIDFTTPT